MTEYDPIPYDVRLAWDNLREVAKAHGLDAPSLLLHTAAPLTHGEDVPTPHRIARYWPRCGRNDGGLSVVSPAPDPAVAVMEWAMATLTPEQIRSCAATLEAQRVVGGAR
jgi:hypothetical protein